MTNDMTQQRKQFALFLYHLSGTRTIQHTPSSQLSISLILVSNYIPIMISRHFALLALVLAVFMSCAGVANAQEKLEELKKKIPQHPGTGISVRDLNVL
jgi:hypothetical protein